MMGRKLFLLLSLSIVLCAHFVLSIGVSPADSYLTYTPKDGLNAELELTLKSTENPPGVATIELVEGVALTAYIIQYQDGWSGLNASEVASYVKINKKTVDFSKGDNKVIVTIKIPPNAPIYGPHEFGLKATETPASSGGISVGTAVIHRVKIDAPFPGQYAELKGFSITNINEGELAELSWGVIGRSEKQTFCAVNLEILSSEGKSMYTKSMGVFSVERGELYPADGGKEYLPTRDFVPGEYVGVITLNFADQNKTATTPFNVGTESVALEEYYPVNLTLGEINSVTITVRNLWNGAFENTYAVIKIEDVSSTTPSVALGPFAKVDLHQFVDTRNIPEGTYNSTIIVNFGNFKTEFPVTFNIVNKTVPIVPEEKESSNVIYYVLGAVVVVLLLLILLFFRNKKSKK